MLRRISSALIVLFPVVVFAYFFRGPRPALFGELAAGNPSRIRLENVTERAGIQHRSMPFTLAPELRHLPFVAEFGGAGIAVGDFDNDGWMDFYVTSPRSGSMNALYRNNHDGTFTDVAPQMGVAAVSGESLASNAAVWVDYDNDGWPDLLVTGTGCSRLYHNLKGKKFEEVAFADTKGKSFCGDTQSVVALDFNGDSLLDLYLVNRSPYDWRNPRGKTNILLPSRGDSVVGPASVLYQNMGGGVFRSVEGPAGAPNDKWAFAAISADFNNDGFPDLFVANDSGADRMFYNDAEKGFVAQDTKKLFLGLIGRDGMNAEAIDFTGDGHLSLFVSKISNPNYATGRNELWVYDADRGVYENRARQLGVDSCGWAWGGVFIDTELRGTYDLLVANGMHTGKARASYWFTAASIGSTPSRVVEEAKYWPPMGDKDMSGHQRACFFYNTGKKFINIGEGLGFEAGLDTRSVALIDIDNNGTQDILLSNTNGRLQLFKNNPVPDNHWVGFRLLTRPKGRDAVGARVKLTYLERGAMKTRMQEIRSGNGFASQSDPRLVFGLGQSTLVDASIRWPNGKTTALKGRIKLDEYNTFTLDADGLAPSDVAVSR